MRRLLRHLTGWAAEPRPAMPAPGTWEPLFPMIDGGALACPDLAAALVTLAVCYPRTNDV